MKGGQTVVSSMLHDQMRKVDLTPNVISFNAAISASEKGRQWEGAGSLLDKMRKVALTPNVISFNAAVTV